MPLCTRECVQECLAFLGPTFAVQAVTQPKCQAIYEEAARGRLPFLYRRAKMEGLFYERKARVAISAVARDTIRHLVIFHGGGREIDGLQTARQCPLLRETALARARAAKNEFSGDRNSPLLLR